MCPVEQENKTEGRPLNEKTGRDPSLVRRLVVCCHTLFNIQGTHTHDKIPTSGGRRTIDEVYHFAGKVIFNILGVCLSLSLCVGPFNHQTSKMRCIDVNSRLPSTRMSNCVSVRISAYFNRFFLFSFLVFKLQRAISSKKDIDVDDKISTRKKKWNLKKK